MPQPVSTAKLVSPFKRLTDAELQRKRERGLCYRCDEKFKPGHKCSNKELQVLVVQEQEENEEIEAPEEKEGDGLGELIKLSIKSVVGLSTPQTMKLQGSISDQGVVMMIDCGATHNFISNELVRKLRLKITSTNSYGVLMGTGLAINGGRVCRGVVVSLPQIDVVEDFLPLKLGCTDVILGMKWLGTLGKIQVNWGALTMHFKVGEETIVLQGDLSLDKSQVALKSIVKSLRDGEQGVLLELGSMGVVAKEMEDRDSKFT